MCRSYRELRRSMVKNPRLTTNHQPRSDDPRLRPPSPHQLKTDDRGLTTNDELWMEEALRAAQRALEAGEVPVGAIVVYQEKVVGRGFNRNILDSDPSAHAEIVAIREAGSVVGNHRLGDCELFVTIEPCAMCAGAMVHARIR